MEARPYCRHACALEECVSSPSLSSDREQHRFGVAQRAFWKKGSTPLHVLVMTATTIPGHGHERTW